MRKNPLMIAQLGTILSLFISQSQITYTMAGTLLNKKWILKQHPNGKFDASRDAELVEEPIDLKLVPDSNIIVEVQALSVDAFIRTMVRQEME